MGSHAQQPTPEQLKPMVEHNRNFWGGFTKAMAISVVSVFVLLGLMLIFLVKHH
ncbi:MAG: hypothetical protein SFW65_01630 [Alphaproteobacteria bacterium]|nr:hypothetical protein [Alphaproteobacteria bacterium]